MKMSQWMGESRPLRATGGAGAVGPPSGLPGSGPPEYELNGTFFGQNDGLDPAERRRFQTMSPVESGPANLELILDSSSALLPFHFLRTGDRLGRAVVKLLRGDGAAGTGFLVAPGILLTNNHVLPDRAMAALATVLANFEAAPPGAPLGRPASVPLDPDSLFVTNAELDFTFCGVRGLDFLGWIALDRNSLGVEASESVNIIQHPRGRPKEVALRDNRVVKADWVVVQYACSTEPGSSGSPVFNNHWEPIALHHASVKYDDPGARPVGKPSDDGSSHYLNEGIRISAIAIWLETDEANGPEQREQVARLRGIFGGIDPQVGFFGALGQKAHGRPALEVIVDGCQGDTDDIDLAFWNLRGLESAFRDQIADIGRVVAEMGMDLWCLTHVDDVCVAALREHLDSHFHLDYEFFHEPAGAHPSLALLYRRSKTLAVERRGWGVEPPEGLDLPTLLTVRTTTRRSGAVAFQLLTVGRPSTDVARSSYAEAVRHAIRRGHGEFDWIVVGEAPIVLAPDRLHVLADCDRELLAAAADRDGAVALLTGQHSKVARVFLSPNLRPALGLPETLTIANDREFLPMLRALGGHQPIALRLSLDGEPRPVPAVDPTPPDVPAFASPPPALSITDDDLERRIKDMLAPILAKLLDEVRSRPAGAEP
jgi:V8-like Glu-specific endopeptidase